MAKFSKMQVMAAMKETGMVPVFFNKDVEICKNVIKACYEGGVRVFEFTNRGDFAHEIFGELVKWADKACPEMILGAGTVVNIRPSTNGSATCAVNSHGCAKRPKPDARTKSGSATRSKNSQRPT